MVTPEASVSHHGYRNSLTPQSRALEPDWSVEGGEHEQKVQVDVWSSPVGQRHITDSTMA